MLASNEGALATSMGAAGIRLSLGTFFFPLVGQRMRICALFYGSRIDGRSPCTKGACAFAFWFAFCFVLAFTLLDAVSRFIFSMSMAYRMLISSAVCF